MFCTSCGAQIPGTARFCVACGNPVKYAEAAPPPRQPEAAAPPVSTSDSKCSWCGAVIDSTETSCPKCGATLHVRSEVTRSGWVQLPGRKDMAKLQFGNSVCQIEGLYVPVADMNLAAGDGIYFTHHVLLWKDPQVDVTTMSLKGAWKRLFAGMPLIMTQAQGPGHIAFSRDAPGEMIAVPVHPGQSIDVREHLFLVATGNVTYDWFPTNIWFTTRSDNNNETHYPVGMFMDRFSSPQSPGLLLLHAAGNVFIRELAPGQTILVKPTALVFKDPTVQMQLHFEHPGAVFGAYGSWSNRYMWLRLSGPGRIAVQSVFERVEGEATPIVKYSYATEQRW